MTEEMCNVCNTNTTCDTCNSCGNAICDECTLATCDWCDHMRTSCDACPICNKVVTLCGGDRVCMTWINTGMYNDEIGYCIVHENFAPTENPPRKCSLIGDPESSSLKYQLLVEKIKE